METPSFSTETSAQIAIKKTNNNCTIEGKELLSLKLQDFYHEINVLEEKEDKEEKTTTSETIENYKKKDFVKEQFEVHENTLPSILEFSIHDEFNPRKCSIQQKVHHKDIDYLRRYSLAMKQSNFVNTNDDKDGCYEICKSETCLFERMLLQKEIDRLEIKIIKFQQSFDNQTNVDNEKCKNQIIDKESNTADYKTENIMSGAAFQIEKDWDIIEQQSVQLDNLHQQYIEQRDLNLSGQLSLRIAETTITKLKEEVKKLESFNENLKETFRVKEKNLETLLKEKETGIETLHLMVVELENSLACSQVRIERILSESIELKKTDQENKLTLKKNNECIDNLNKEIKMLQHNLERKECSYDKSNIDIKANVCNVQYLRTFLNCLSQDYKVLKKEYTSSMELLKHALAGINDALKLLLSYLPSGDMDIEHFDMLVFELKSILKQCPFILKESSIFFLQPSMNSYENKKSFRQIRRENNDLVIANKDLKKKLELSEQQLQVQEEVHRLQVDTIIDSLAKRCNVIPPIIKKPLVPSIHLTNVAKQQNSQQFLQYCLNQIEEQKTQ